MEPSKSFLRALREELAPGLFSDDPSDLEEYGRDWTRVHAPAPMGVVFPRHAEEVVRIVSLAREEGVALVPSGGRTGLAGGAVAKAGELVVSMGRMRRMEPVDTVGETVRVEAGAVTEAVHQHAAEVGLTWPVDFASKGSSQLGGNIATNAGGVRVIRYGLTRQWVRGLEVVTADGQLLELGGPLEKDNTGFDLKQLFIGSEGTLGLITGATLKLTRLPGEVHVLLFALDGLKSVLQLFSRARQGPFRIMAYEYFSDRCMDRLHRHRGVEPPFDARAPAYVLLEVEDVDEEALLEWTESVLDGKPAIDGTMAQNRQQADFLWSLREGISESLSATGLPHKNDVALPIAALPEFVDDLEREIGRRYPDYEICLFGHIGDGNLHINVMKPDDMDAGRFLAHTHEADQAVFEVVRHHRGSISAEHGIGLLKKDFLPYSRSEGEVAMFRAIKRALDPDDLFNPGKVFDRR